MKHLVASSIAAPSVPCFSPQPFLSLLYLSGTSTLENLVYGTACNDQHSSLLQPLPEPPKCGSSTPSLTEKPVIFEKLSSAEDLWKITIQTPRSPSHPFLTSLLLNLHLAVFLTRHEFCFDGQKTELYGNLWVINSANHETCAENHSLCYKICKRLLSRQM